MRFGAGIDAPLAWQAELPAPVRAYYDAGPTGFGLYRAAVAAGIGMQVIAPGKSQRGPSDHVKKSAASEIAGTFAASRSDATLGSDGDEVRTDPGGC